MSDIDKVVAEMPKVKVDSPYHDVTAAQLKSIYAQCRLLAEQGYRKVLSEEKLGFLLYEVLGLEHVFAEDVKELHQRLLEGEE